MNNKVKMKNLIVLTILFEAVLLSFTANTLAVDPPSDGMVLWLKADAGVTQDGNGTITVWQDQSGNNNHATKFPADDPNSDPNIIVWSLPSGNYNTVLFDGNDAFKLTNESALRLTSFNCYIVLAIAPDSISQVFFGDYSVGDGGNQYGWAVGLSDNQAMRVKHFTGQYIPGVSTQTLIASEVLTGAKGYLLETAVKSGTSSLKTLSLYDETGRVSMDAVNHQLLRYDPTPANQNAYIGVVDVGQYGGLLQYTTGVIAEIMIYDMSVPVDPNTVVANIRSYLGDKYGLVTTVPVFDPDDPAAVWDITDQFSFTDNPGEYWSYGWGEGMDDFHLYDTEYTTNHPIWYDSATPTPLGQGPLLWKNTGDALPSEGVATGEVAQHPSPTLLAKARWTSVIDDLVACSGTFGAGGSGSVDIYIVKDGSEILLEEHDVAADLPFEVRTAVVPDTTIDFVIGAGISFSGEHTPLDIQITRSELRCQDLDLYLSGDMNTDCYINLEDFAIFAQDWLKCNDPLNPECTDVP